MFTSKNFFNLFFYLFCLLPFLLISGPFLPDLIISLSSLYCLVYFFYIKDFSKKSINLSLFLLLFLFFIYINFTLLINLTNNLSEILSSIVYIRFFLITIFLGYIFTDTKKILTFYKFTTLAIVFISIDIIADTVK